MQPSPLSHVLKLPEYRTQRAHIFHSPAALEWFVRKHRPGLIRAGALLMVTGQWHVHAEKFDSFVLEVGQAAAERHAEPRTAQVVA